MNDEPAPIGTDPSVPSVARIYDYYIGGKDNYAVDREAANEAAKIHPGGLDACARAASRTGGSSPAR